jgi:excisionase family DNA binding protein
VIEMDDHAAERADPRTGDDEEDIDQLLTVDDVSAWFQVTKGWVYDEVEARRLPHLRLGRKHLRFRRPQLEQYLDTRSHRAATPPSPALPPPPPYGDLEPLD